MSSEATTNIDKITALIKEECQKENIDISSFVLSGEYSKCTGGSQSTSELREAKPIKITNN